MRTTSALLLAALAAGMAVSATAAEHAPITVVAAPGALVPQVQPAARAATPKPAYLKLAAFGTPKIGLYPFIKTTEAQALKSLEQEASLKVGKHVRASDYPYEARRWRWTGTTLIELLIDGDGLVRDVVLQRSSGFRILDESALSVARRVSKLFVPFLLRGREHAVVVPVGFYLKGN